MDEERFAPRIPARDDVTVSEAAAYSFCAKAWHLEHTLRRPASRDAVGRRAVGTALHQEYAVEVARTPSVGTRLLIWSIVLLGLAAVLLVLGIFVAR